MVCDHQQHCSEVSQQLSHSLEGPRVCWTGPGEHNPIAGMAQDCHIRVPAVELIHGGHYSIAHHLLRCGDLLIARLMLLE